MSYTLTTSDISRATNSGKTRVRNFLTLPYQLDFQLDASGPQGGGRIKRYRLSDVLGRIRGLPWFKADHEQRLAATDQAYRQAEGL